MIENIGMIFSVDTPLGNCEIPWTRDMYLILVSPNPILRGVRSEMARRRFSLEEGLRRVSKCEITEIPSEENLVSLSNIDNT